MEPMEGLENMNSIFNVKKNRKGSYTLQEEKIYYWLQALKGFWIILISPKFLCRWYNLLHNCPR